MTRNWKCRSYSCKAYTKLYPNFSHAEPLGELQNGFRCNLINIFPIILVQAMVASFEIIATTINRTHNEEKTQKKWNSDETHRKNEKHIEKLTKHKENMKNNEEQI